MHREEIPLFCVEKFLSHSTETFRRETLLCFRKLLVSKNFMDKKCDGRDCHVFLRKFFCLTVLKVFVGELLRVSEIFESEKNFWVRRWVGYHLFSSKILRLTVLIIFVGENYNVSKSLGHRKSLGKRRGRGYYDSLWKNFCITGPKVFVEAPFCASENFWYRKNLGIRVGGQGISGLSVGKNLWYCTEIFRRGDLQCFRNFGYRKNVWISGGVVSRSTVDSFLYHSAKKNRGGSPMCFRKFWVRKTFMYKKGGIDFVSEKCFVSQC